MMKKLFTLCCLLWAATALAQDVDLNKKTGLVTVDGKPLFYLTGKNKVLWQSDYSLENLQHQELAYLKAEQGQYYNNASHSYQDETFYSCTFSQSGNYCEIHGFTSLSIMKSLAKAVASASLVQDDAISDAAERKFIVMHNGVFIHEQAAPPPPQVVVVNNGGPNNGVTTEGTPRKANISISISGQKIYNGDEHIADFRQQDNGLTTIVSIYAPDDSKVGEATHKNKSDDDWNLSITRGGKVFSIRYHDDSPLVKLFQYLAEKGYL